jgi:hypothetical protein
VQDYDIPLIADFVAHMHDAIKRSRDLVVLYTSDYEDSPHTRKEWTSFEADRRLTGEERRIIVLRCEDTALRGLFAANVYQDLVGVDDPAERKKRILDAVDGKSTAQRPPPRVFAGVSPRLTHFAGRTEALERLDDILTGGKAAAITQTIGRAAVSGLGGVGKSSLACEYAHRYRDLYAGVWQAPAESRSGLLASLAGLAVQLGAARADDANVENAAKAGLRRLAGQRATWLLIYDNVTEPGDIADLMPAGGARLLITSRFSDWSAYAEELALDVLAPQEAVDFLLTTTGRKDVAGAALLAENRAPAAGAGSRRGVLPAHGVEFRRLRGAGGKAHGQCSARRRLSEKRRRNLRTRHCGGGKALHRRPCVDGLSVLLRAGTHSDDFGRGRDRGRGRTPRGDCGAH